MVLPRVLVLLCVMAAVVLSETPGTGVGAELVSSLRQLEEEVVKVHVKVHQKEIPQPQLQDVAPLRQRKHHKKDSGEDTAETGETVRNYDHGSVHIESKGANAGKRYRKNHHEKVATKKEPTDETVVEYTHGTVKTSGKGKTMSDGGTKDKSKKAATLDEKEVTKTANEVSTLVTKLNSTDSTNNKSIIDIYGPVVVICGIIGALAAIIGVAGLVMSKSQSNDDDKDSVLSASDSEFDVEASLTSADRVQDAIDDGDDLLDDSDSNAVEGEEEEGTFANGTAHVSV